MLSFTAPEYDTLNLYNNSYTMNIELDTVECQDIEGVTIDCLFNGDPPGPTYSNGVCSNVVLRVSLFIH